MKKKNKNKKISVAFTAVAVATQLNILTHTKIYFFNKSVC